MTSIVRDKPSSDPAIIALREKLDAFYAKPKKYTVFEQSVSRDAEYDAFIPLVATAISRRPLRVLEVGAGRSDFANYATRRGLRLAYDAQDVTAANEDYLKPLAHELFVGDIRNIGGPYDLIFSTFVVEHVSNPREFFEQIDRLLSPGGFHVIICPRYDLPGYLCPSLRHRPAMERFTAKASLALQRFAALFEGKPAFLINTDPAMFHRDWFTDADAVHLVSRRDLERWHRGRGYRVKRLRLPDSSLKDKLRTRLLTAAVAFRKPS